MEWLVRNSNIGSQLEVSHPQNALIQGLARVARAEYPALVLTTLDVETGSSPEASVAISKVLHSLQGPVPKTQIENEYCERRGIIYISRVLPVGPTNQAERDNLSVTKVPLQSLHDNKACVRVLCEGSGTIDSLHFSEVSTREIPLIDDFVEVDIHAAGLNFKVLSAISCRHAYSAEIFSGRLTSNEYCPWEPSASWAGRCRGSQTRWKISAPVQSWG